MVRAHPFPPPPPPYTSTPRAQPPTSVGGISDGMRDAVPSLDAGWWSFAHHCIAQAHRSKAALRSASSCTSESRSSANAQHNSTRAKHTTTLPSLSRRPSVLTPPFHFAFVRCVTQGVVGVRLVVRWQARPKGAVHLHTHGAWRCMRRLWSWLFYFQLLPTSFDCV